MDNDPIAFRSYERLASEHTWRAAIDNAAPHVDPADLKQMPLLDPGAWQDQETPDRRWLLDGWIPHNQATYLTGPGSAGKSLLAQQLCTCIALGLPFMGIPTEQKPTLYLSCEDDQDELHRRQKAICAHLAAPLSALSGKLNLVSLAGQIGAELATFEQPQRDETGTVSPLIRPTPRFRALERVAIAHGAAFIALDNVAHLFAGNENIRVEVAAFMSLMNRLAMRANGAVLLLGHPNKAGDSFSGSTAWENQVRSRIFLETPKDENGHAADPDLRVLSRQKANYARNGETIAFRWHQWAFVQDGDLPEDQQAAIAENARASSDNAIFLACLAERNKQRRPVSEMPSPNYAPTQFAKMAESKNIGKARLEAAMDRLFRLGRIERAFVCRDENKRRDNHGLVEVQNGAPNGAPNGAQTLAPNRPNLPAQTARNIHLIPKGIFGAATEAAAPDEVIWDDEPEHDQ
ncbi:AAA family ATPase [Allosphingosinicella deserti]|uniref:Uncharacterized protein n=1 Tax=Allosphingosinicella deserti TaxID=2116704 RepID=A0A2P7QW19_9SPHN|nr:AAA family ATPase [Sphingomonas deserti]PSJ42157.1 hypothetical protein C7I55_07945 [Sphingomonas deserti]